MDTQSDTLFNWLRAATTPAYLYFVLKNHDAIPAPDIETWNAAFADPDARRVALTKVSEAEISTVFLGVNHNFCSYGRPMLFETLVFGGNLDGIMVRYATWDEAVVGHREMVKRVKRRG